MKPEAAPAPAKPRRPRIPWEPLGICASTVTAIVALAVSYVGVAKQNET